MAEPLATDSTPQLATWPKDALRITFGVIWLIDAIIKWLPGFRTTYMSGLVGEAQGQPGWLRPWFNFWTNLSALGAYAARRSHTRTLTFKVF